MCINAFKKVSSAQREAKGILLNSEAHLLRVVSWGLVLLFVCFELPDLKALDGFSTRKAKKINLAVNE